MTHRTHGSIVPLRPRPPQHIAAYALQVSRMWPLRAFLYDEGILSEEVYVYSDEAGELELVARDDAIAAARSQGRHLIAWWPSSADDHTPSCIVGTLTLPLRWEQIPDEDPLELDERLWFEASCGGRDLLLHGQGHTFRGRMSAWCPNKAVAYNVSLTEMGEMSLESRYFVLGFLSGNEPDPPEDDEGNADEADMCGLAFGYAPLPPLRKLVRPLGDVRGVRLRAAP